jgi:HK97 family phage portal protein
VSLLFGRTEHRDITWDGFWGGPRGKQRVEGDRALRVIPVYAAVSLLADSMASMPMQLYKGTGAGRTRLPDNGFLDDPDTSLSTVDWICQLVVSLKLRGNAYGIIAGNGHRIDSIKWIHPDQMAVDESGSYPVYRWKGGEEELDFRHGGRILHIRDFLVPGKFKGLSPIGVFQNHFETWQAAADYGYEFFESNGIPSGILKNTAATLEREQTRVAKESFMEAMRKPGPVALDKNWDWTKVSVSPQESQFLDTIKATSTQIAAIFRVNPEDIGGETGNSLTYSNREQDQLRINIRTLTPLAVRIEKAFKPLLPPGQFMKFNMDALARPATLDRIRGNNEALKGGQLTQPEVRALEDRPPLTDEEIAFWRENYQTMRTESESTSTSTSTSTAVT